MTKFSNYSTSTNSKRPRLSKVAQADQARDERRAIFTIASLILFLLVGVVVLAFYFQETRVVVQQDRFITRYDVAMLQTKTAYRYEPTPSPTLTNPPAFTPTAPPYRTILVALPYCQAITPTPGTYEKCIAADLLPSYSTTSYSDSRPSTLKGYITCTDGRYSGQQSSVCIISFPPNATPVSSDGSPRLQ